MDAECNYLKSPKIAVLLSAYNGEKYIKEQINSILNQTYKNLVLYIRDDGSTDNTFEIIKDFAKRNRERVKCFSGSNRGFINSFITLLIHCEHCDYYAWSDQDDVWLPEKIERAVFMLEKDRRKTDKIEPVLYFSDYDYYNEEMLFEKHGLIHERGPSFENSLFDCIPLGFCSVFNNRTRDMFLKNIPHYCCGHDWWTYMLCAAFGHVIYDKGFVSVKYRRRNDSVSPGGMPFLRQQIWRFKKFFLGNYFLKIRQQLLEFNRLYAYTLNEKDRQLISLFQYDNPSLKKWPRKVFYPCFFRQNITEEVMLRVLFAIGQL